MDEEHTVWGGRQKKLSINFISIHGLHLEFRKRHPFSQALQLEPNSSVYEIFLLLWDMFMNP